MSSTYPDIQTSLEQDMPQLNVLLLGYSDAGTF